MNKLHALDWISVILAFVGGLNWVLVGFFKLDLIATIFGEMRIISSLVYCLVGFSTISLVGVVRRLAKK